MLLLLLHCFLVLPYHDRGMVVSLCEGICGHTNGSILDGGPLTTTGVLACLFDGIRRTGLGLRWGLRWIFLGGQFTTTTGTGRRILRNGGIDDRSSDREEEQRNKNRRGEFHDEIECCVRVYVGRLFVFFVFY